MEVIEGEEQFHVSLRTIEALVTAFEAEADNRTKLIVDLYARIGKLKEELKGLESTSAGSS